MPPMAPETMQAAIREAYGSPDVVEVREVERPVPAADEVLVRVQAASVNRADLDSILPKPGFLRLGLGLRKPRNPRVGSDVAGIVEAIGAGRDPLPPRRPRVRRPVPLLAGQLRGVRDGPGARVPADPRWRLHRGCVDAPALRGPCRPGPPSARRDHVRTRAKVLIDGASGNVGPFAVQIAKAAAPGDRRVLPAKVGLRAIARRGPRHRLPRGRLHAAGERYDWIVDVELPPPGCSRPERGQAGGCTGRWGRRPTSSPTARDRPLASRDRQALDGPDARLEAIQRRVRAVTTLILAAAVVRRPSIAATRWPRSGRAAPGRRGATPGKVVITFAAYQAIRDTSEGAASSTDHGRSAGGVTVGPDGLVLAATMGDRTANARRSTAFRAGTRRPARAATTAGRRGGGCSPRRGPRHRSRPAARPSRRLRATGACAAPSSLPRRRVADGADLGLVLRAAPLADQHGRHPRRAILPVNGVEEEPDGDRELVDHRTGHGPGDPRGSPMARPGRSSRRSRRGTGRPCSGSRCRSPRPRGRSGGRRPASSPRGIPSWAKTRSAASTIRARTACSWAAETFGIGGG